MSALNHGGIPWADRYQAPLLAEPEVLPIPLIHALKVRWLGSHANEAYLKGAKAVKRGDDATLCHGAYARHAGAFQLDKEISASPKPAGSPKRFAERGCRGGALGHLLFGQCLHLVWRYVNSQELIYRHFGIFGEAVKFLQKGDLAALNSHPQGASAPTHIRNLADQL